MLCKAVSSGSEVHIVFMQQLSYIAAVPVWPMMREQSGYGYMVTQGRQTYTMSFVEKWWQSCVVCVEFLVHNRDCHFVGYAVALQRRRESGESVMG